MKPCLFLLLVSCTCLCLAQSETAAGGKLRFAVVVTDAHGTPIRNLRSADFVVEVGGKTVPQVESIAAPSKATEGDDSSKSGVKGRGLVVVVLDTIHGNWVDEKEVRAYAGQYLGRYAKRDAPISLLVLSRDGTLHAVHEYTAGSATLTAALARADAEMRHRADLEDASPEVIDEARRFVDFYKGTSNEFAWAQQHRLLVYPDAVLDGFHTVAAYTANIPGPKSLIWVSGMTPFEVEEKQGRVASLAYVGNEGYHGTVGQQDLLTEDEVRKLQIVWKTAMEAVQHSEIALFPVLTRTLASRQVDTEILRAMAGLARMTGGREVHVVGDSFKQLEDLPEINAAAYEVLLPPEAAHECKSGWCELKIAVKRAEGRVLAPNGFFRDMSAVQPNATLSHLPISASSPAPEAGADSIPFTINWKPAEALGKRKRLAFVVTFGPEAHIPKDSSNELDLEITVHAISNGADRQAVKFDAKTQVSLAMIEQMHLRGFMLSNAIDLEPGDYDIQFIVHDKASGRMGIVHSPLKVS